MGKSIKAVLASALGIPAVLWEILDWTGRAEVFITSPTKLSHIQEFIVEHQSLGYQIAPWAIMLLSGVFLVTLQWPGIWASIWQRLKRRHSAAGISEADGLRLKVAQQAWALEKQSRSVSLPQTTASSEFMPLPEAARLAFEAVEGTDYATAATNTFHAPRGALAYMATLIFTRINPPVTVYGKRLPSTRLLPLTGDALFGGDFAEGASDIRKDGGTGILTHSDLSIDRQELPRILEYVREKSGQGKSAIAISADRAPLKDVYRRAWQRESTRRGDDSFVRTLTNALRQAGVDGELQFFGRRPGLGSPLVKVPSEHWTEFSIEWTAAFDFAGQGAIAGISDAGPQKPPLYSYLSDADSRRKGEHFNDLHVLLSEVDPFLARMGY